MAGTEERGMSVYTHDTDGDRTWTVYDSAGRRVHKREQTGDFSARETYYEYDASGRNVYRKTSGFGRIPCEIRLDYDDAGNMVHFKNSRGYERWSEYDSSGRKIHSWDNAGSSVRYDYDGNVVHAVRSWGSGRSESWTERNGFGDVVRSWNSSGDEWVYENDYDPAGRRVRVCSHGRLRLERRYDYDSEGRQVCCRGPGGFEERTEYTPCLILVDRNEKSVHVIQVPYRPKDAGTVRITELNSDSLGWGY